MTDPAWVRQGTRGSASAPPLFPEAPTEAELTTVIETAPPMRGFEFLTVQVLQNLWHEVLEEFAERAGRLSNRSQVQHLPLAEALRHFAAEKEQQMLAGAA